MLKKRKLRNRLVGAASIGVAAMTATMTLGAGSASAFTPPPFPTLGVYPQFLSGNVEPIRTAGSDTTFYMMQQITDLYNGAALYGCVENTTTEASCSGSAGDNNNASTTDTADNFDRVEVTDGTDDIGSGAGQNQLCDQVESPLSVNFSRSSKPPGSITGCNMVGTGYAKDGVAPVDFPTANPGLIGQVSTAPGSYGGYQMPWAATAYGSTNQANGDNGLVGPVAKGWLPGDPIAGPYSGVPLSQTGVNPAGGYYGMSNLSGTTTTLGQNSSVAYRLWCANNADGDGNQITDWGQLTNLKATGPGNGGVAQPVGNGAPIGIPIRIVGVNSASGTVATWAGYASSGYASTRCNSTNETEINAANYVGNNIPALPPQALENNASQIGDFAADDLPNDPADQAVEVATSLYFMGNGSYSVNNALDAATIVPGTGTIPAGVPTTYVAQELDANNKAPSLQNDLHNLYPTARTLFNIFATGGPGSTIPVTASTADFLNWVCDANNEPAGDPLSDATNPIVKEVDHQTDVNFDTEMSTVIGTDYGFTRLDNATPELANNVITPADGLTAPNGSCAATTNAMTTTATLSKATLSTTGGVTTVTLNSGADFPSAITVGTSITDPQYGGYGTNLTSDIPAGDTVATVGPNGSYLTLTTPDVADTTSDVLFFPGVDPVTEVGTAGLSK